jgi:hypothetical protein
LNQFIETFLSCESLSQNKKKKAKQKQKQK